MSPKRKLAIGAVVLAACAFAGGAYAATKATSPKHAFLNDVASRLNVSPQKLTSALEGALIDQLNAAVKAGRLTQARANRIEQRIRQGRFPLFRFRAGRAFGPRGPLAPFGPLGPLGARGGLLSIAASYIGVTEQQLLGQLGDGKSLAQIASAHGKTAAGLESALTADLRSKLDRARAAGRITQAQEQRLLARLETAIGNLVNRTGLGPRFGPRFLPRSRFGLVPPPVAPGFAVPAPPPGPST